MSETATALLGKKRQLKELNPTWNSPKRFRPNEDCLENEEADSPSHVSSSSSAETTPEPVLAVTYENILAAAKRIENGVLKSPCRLSKKLSKMCDANIFVKNDYLQMTGSFKERGALNSILQLTKAKRAQGIIAASAGNHALALAYHGSRLGVPVTVVMPTIAPMTKISNCRELGAEVIVDGSNFTEATNIAKSIGVKRNLTYIHAFDNPPVIAGQGSIGLEILEQCPEVHAVLVPVGGGGLIAGVGMAIKEMHPEVEVIGVEPATCASLCAALKLGRPVEIEACPTIADGLAVKEVGSNVFPIVQKYVDRVVTVDEHHIALAVLRLVEQEKAVVEGAGAVALAAMLAGILPELKAKNVVILLCGGNIDVTLLGRVIDHGLAADGRISRFKAIISDRAGSLSAFTKVIGDTGASIMETTHDRAFTGDEFSMVRVECTVATRDAEHRDQLAHVLSSAGYPCKFSAFTAKEWMYK